MDIAITRTNKMSRPFPSSREAGASAVYTVGGEMSDKNLEQRINFKFFIKSDKSSTETLALLTFAYDEYAMKKLGVFE
jgi:hypothetical protein